MLRARREPPAPRGHASLATGRVRALQWSRAGERFATITVQGGRDRIILSYRCRPHGGNWEEVSEPVPIKWAPCRYGGERPYFDWEEVSEPVPIKWAPCRYGGERPYFACPGVVNGIVCGRSVEELYCAGRYYLCRHCYGLTYGSRNEDRWGRALRRANAIRTKLGGDPGVNAAVPNRPKGMWGTTYARLRQEIDEAEGRAEERLVFVAARLLARANKPRRRMRKAYWR